MNSFMYECYAVILVQSAEFWQSNHMAVQLSGIYH